MKETSKKAGKATPTSEAKANIPKRSEQERRENQATRLSRLLRLLACLAGRGKWNAKNLAAELECSEKTVRRYLQTLQIAGYSTYCDKNDGYYRFLRDDLKFPVFSLTADELLEQAAATAITKEPSLNVAASASHATRKIAVGSRKNAELLADAEMVMAVVDMKLANHSEHREIIRTAQWALIQKRQITGQYLTPYQEKSIRLILHPYRLCFAGQAWYLIARADNEKRPKTYRIARFRSMRQMETPASTPANFDLDKYFGNAWCVFQGDETYDVEIEFTKDAAKLVQETQWHKTQQVKKLPDGCVQLSFRVDGLEEIVWWVLGWSGRAKVLKPQKLREMVIEKLQEALKMQQS